MKKPAVMMLLACLFPCGAFAQSAGGTGTSSQITCPDPDVQHEPDTSFCENKPQPEVRAFCKRLARLQTYANAHPGVAPECFRALLSNLDLTADLGQKLNNTMPAFISATSAELATRAAVADVVRNVGQARPDRQIGPGSQANGTTSLVSKAGSSELIALALDAGVLTRSVNGATTTLSTNADQLFRLISGRDPDCIIHCAGGNQFQNKVLNFVNISASFDVAQPNSTNTTTSGQASGTTAVSVSSATVPTGVGKLSSITARYQMLNRFDPRGEKFKEAWRKQVDTLADKVIPIGEDTEAVFAVLKTHSPWSGAAATASPADRAALTSAQDKVSKLVPAAVADSSGAQLVTAFESFWSSVVTDDVKRDNQLATAVAKAMQDRAIYRDAWLGALHNAVGNLLTVQYSFNRPVQQPETHDLKLIYGYNFDQYGMLTFNGSASLYSTVPAGAKYGRLHYGQVSAEYDRNLSNTASALQAQMSLAGYWQYQPEPSVLNIPNGTVAPGTSIPVPNGTQVFVGTAGSLYVTQAKITIKAAGGIEVPIGVSWSNKTELLTGSRVGGQFGINYNFSSLANLFSSSKQ